MRARRVILPPSGHQADGNAKVRHPAEKAAWIWHPGVPEGKAAVLRFRLRFMAADPMSPLIHVTADQRFQLRCDGSDLSFGPDRCDVEHWTVQTLRLDLSPGEHELEALVWWLPGSTGNIAGSAALLEGWSAPMAQMSCRGGFLLAVEGVAAQLLDTGAAPWTVEDLTGAVTFTRVPLPGYHDVGPSFTIDLAGWHGSRAAEQPATVIAPALQANGYGLRSPGWCLYPAQLPEQHRRDWTGGRIRAVRDGFDDSPALEAEGDCDTWQRLIDGGEVVTVAPGSSLSVLWDLGEYRCGYPAVAFHGGAGAMIGMDWAEALYQETEPAQVTEQSAKGRRDLIEGKVFTGFGDTWRVGSAAPCHAPSLWWRCGRYVRLRVATAADPLVITRLGLRLTGYPLTRESSWESSDPSWDRLMPIFDTSYRVSAHETWTDTPYYEQMCYVGDTLLSCRSNYAWYSDDRLSRRALQLFDWSRHGSGLVAERYPSTLRQESATYALLWPIMVRDYAWWRDDPAFVRRLLPGVRGVLDEFDQLADGHLLAQVPGWPFVDWVPHWPYGCGPGVREGDSSIVNLHWVLALLAAADVEQAHGDPVLARRCRDRATAVFAAIMDRYWDDERAILLDTQLTSAASEHAQMFALITGLLDAERANHCLDALRDRTDLAQATIYASYYLLEALYQHGRSDDFHRRLDFWRALPDQGFTTTPEAPEPSRSDAHAWGAHPAWHTLAGIAGVRPDAPGFTRVRIRPMPGPLRTFTARVVHPRGTVDVTLDRTPSGQARYLITLPDGVDGRLEVGGGTFALRPGANRVDT